MKSNRKIIEDLKKEFFESLDNYSDRRVPTGTIKAKFNEALIKVLLN